MGHIFDVMKCGQDRRSVVTLRGGMRPGLAALGRTLTLVAVLLLGAPLAFAQDPAKKPAPLRLAQEKPVPDRSTPDRPNSDRPASDRPLQDRSAAAKVGQAPALSPQGDPQAPAAQTPLPVPVRPDPLVGLDLSASQVETLGRFLETAQSHGLKGAERLAELRVQGQASGKEGQRARQKLLQLALDLGTQIHSGQLPDDKFLNVWGLRPVRSDLGTSLAKAVTSDQLAGWIGTLAPPYAGYESLREGLLRYRQIAAAGGWGRVSPLPEGVTAVRIGDRLALVDGLRLRLAAEDPAAGLPTAGLYDQNLSLAVARAQKRFGLNPTGELDAKTLTALNVPVSVRVDQILANMERWRWLPQTLPADRIQVNVAAAVLTLYQGDQPVMSMRAVTGSPKNATPLLSSTISSIVINPPWHVPAGIARKELWPKEAANPGYLARSGYRVVVRDDGMRQLVQSAGERSALGRIKFDFPSPYGVYLHDTPLRSKFANYSRLESHGCVRLERPVDLATAILAPDPKGSEDQVRAMIDEGKTQRLSVSKPISVMLFYWTAYVTPDGAVNFRDDPYGWDRVLIRKIDEVRLGA